MKGSIYIEAPVETVFDFFKDPRKGADITVPGTAMELREVKVTEEGTGTFTSWRAKIAGIPFEGFNVYTDVVPNKRITDRASNALVGIWEYTFEPEGTGTRLTLEHQSRSFWRLPLLRNVLDMTMSRMNAAFMPKLKAGIEAEARKQKTDLPRQRKPAAGKARKPAASH